ncbi:MAG: mannan endo-1,4-beta-mannosidase, partial [Halobacteria archaeon]|nr:mannan endo-1,4-beta-mannosidase [Halobacteria archaeon]
KYNGSMGTDYIRNHRPDSIDICSFHLYPDHYGMDAEESIEWIESHVREAHEQLGKPVYLGEFGLKNVQKRPGFFSEWYSKLAELDADGALLWQLIKSSRDDEDGFSVYMEDEKAVSEIRAYSEFVDAKMG